MCTFASTALIEWPTPLGSLLAITVGPRRLLLAVLTARLFVLKLLSKAIGIGNRIAGSRLMSPVEAHDAVEIC
jgi:hypothetical protein